MARQPRRLSAIVLLDRYRGCAHEIALGCGEVRVQDIEYQNRPRCVAIVPGFVLDRVIESPRSPRPPVAPLGADAETAFSRKNEGNVNRQAGVRGTGMRRDVRASIQDREE